MEELRRLIIKYFILSSILFLSDCILTAQEGLYKIEWLPNGRVIEEIDGTLRTTEYLRLVDANYLADYIPEYHHTFLITEDNLDFFLNNLQYEPVPDSQLRYVYIPKVLPNNTPSLYKCRSKGKARYLEAFIPAIRINHSNGRIERLIGFEITGKPAEEQGEKPGFQDHADKSADNSLLGTGQWYKIKVMQSGIYKLNYSDITSMGFSDPGDIRIFGNGGKQLSYKNYDPRPVDLVEIPIYMNKGSDGIFNQGDYILFYAEGPVTWSYDTLSGIFRQTLHGYSNAIYYFLTTSHGPAKIIPTIDDRNLSENISVTGYDDYAYYEREYYNLIESGRRWYSRQISEELFDTTFSFPNLLTNATIKISSKVAGRSDDVRQCDLMVNDQKVLTIDFPNVSFLHSFNTYAIDQSLDYEYTSSEKQQTIGIKYHKIDMTDLAFLDYITVNARSDIRINNSSLFFRDINSVGDNNIARFTVKNATENTRIWDITDLNDVQSIQGQFVSGEYGFKAYSDELRQYVALNLDGNFATPMINENETGVGEVPNQNIRALPVNEYIIIAPDVFLEQAQRLAEYRHQKDGLATLVVTPQMIYNEFSSGTPDISAIRDFLRHQYTKSTGSDSLRYVLLFGDGSYNNHMYTEGNTNYILTYQSNESLVPTASFVSDDFYGIFNDQKREVEGKLDIGIGRLTVKLNDGENYEAEDVVNKIISYDTCKFTDWRRTLCFVGDDGWDPGGVFDNTSHMELANQFATYIENTYPGFEIKKVFLDAYPQVNTASGSTYPEVNKELQNLFSKGILIFSYNGHGGENQITGERILERQDVIGMENAGVLPLFITATCQFSKYDHVVTEGANVYDIVSKTTIGEEALINPHGGAIALFSTSRLVYTSQNEDLVMAILSHIFKKDPYGHPLRLGDIIRKAKNDLGYQTNKLNFTLLGDPATTLKYPEFLVCTDSINNVPVGQELDTLKALSMIHVSGYVAYDDSTIISDFNGFVYPCVYDKKVEITTFANDPGVDPYVYKDQKNLLYKGEATVHNGRFQFSFVVPKDISYNIDYGKISYYAENGAIDAKGEFRGVLIGGSNEEAADDFDGPEINLFMNDNRFKDGGMTDSDPYIYAELFDQMGINTTGVGIGHDIVALLDENSQEPYVLNDYYEATVDDYQSGTVRYQLHDLESGEHQLLLKVWDVYNNSAESSIGFVVILGDGLILESVYNYPNPANEVTYFQYTHNSPGEEHEVTLEVFDLSGRLVTRICETRYESGFVSQPLEWDLKSSGNEYLSPGIYPYRLRVKTSLGTSYINQKLIIMR
jgi:hypothetical protein